MATPDDAKAKAAAAYDAAADFYDDPANSFWERFSRRTIERLRLLLYMGFNPWDRTSDPAAVRALLHAGGAEQVEVVAEAGTHPIRSPEAWWSAVLGTGFRGTLEQLDAGARERLRLANVNFIRQSGIRSVEANVVYAVATKAVNYV